MPSDHARRRRLRDPRLWHACRRERLWVRLLLRLALLRREVLRA